MSKNPFVKGKRETVEMVRKLIEKEGEISQTKLIGVMGVYGCTEKTTVSYLRNLQDADFIEFDAKKQVWKIKT